MKMKRMEKQNKWMAGVIILLLLLAAVPVKTVEAASATIMLTTDMEEIHAGDTVEVKLTINADAAIGDFEAFLSYDDTIFEFYSAASCITGGAGFLKVSDIGASPSAQERTYRIWFKALTQGECEVALYDRPVVYCYTDGTEMSVTGVNKVFSVLPSFSASDNNYLSVLHMVDNQPKTVELSPAFSKEVQTYHGDVSFEATMVIVSAIAEDSLANVKVEGGKDLEVGNNEIKISVIAENGSERTYTIYINRTEYEEDSTTKPDEENNEADNLENPTIVYEPGIVFDTIVSNEKEEQVLVTEYHTYTVCKKPESLSLPDGYIPTILMINNIQVTAYTKQGANPEEFLLLVLKNNAGEVNWYRYDRIEQTLQRVSEEEYVITQIVKSNDESLKAAIAEYEINQFILTFAVALLIGICLLMLGVILWLCIRRKNRG